MAKAKQKDKEADPKNVVGKDALQRMNFLLQASALTRTSITNPKPFRKHKNARDKRRRPKFGRNHPGHDMSQQFAQDVKSVGLKTQTRPDPHVKRAICKECSALLIPGATSRVRVKKSGPHRHVIATTCQKCTSRRKLPAPPEIHCSQTGDRESVSPETKDRRAKEPPFFERKDHIVFKGDERIFH